MNLFLCQQPLNLKHLEGWKHLVLGGKLGKVENWEKGGIGEEWNAIMNESKTRLNAAACCLLSPERKDRWLETDSSGNWQHEYTSQGVTFILI